jgi:hypothetical protein
MSQEFRHRSQEQRYSTFAELIEDAYRQRQREEQEQALKQGTLSEQRSRFYRCASPSDGTT